MTLQTTSALADYLQQVDREWREKQGYTGRAVHRRAYWMNMAARILSDGTKQLKATK